MDPHLIIVTTFSLCLPYPHGRTINGPISSLLYDIGQKTSYIDLGIICILAVEHDDITCAGGIYYYFLVTQKQMWFRKTGHLLRLPQRHFLPGRIILGLVHVELSHLPSPVSHRLWTIINRRRIKCQHTTGKC